MSPETKGDTVLIDANHLRLSVQGQDILKDVSLHLRRGELVGLLGPNGAGKSTTIAVLLGLHSADSGDLKVFADGVDDIVAMRRRVGVMPERAGFYDWMTAGDYLSWYASFYGEPQRPVVELLQQLGLGDTASKPIGQFSRGMKQRLALARALVHGPELLILDEPTNGFDPRGRHEIHDLLLQLSRQDGVGILLCTHLLDDVERLCDGVSIIDQGRTVAEGRLAEMLGQHDTRQRFRLRMTNVPDPQSLPKGITLLHRDGDWWYFEVSTSELSFLSGLWEDLIVHGWGFSEIHADSGGLESLYLQLTTHGDVVPEEASV